MGIAAMMAAGLIVLAGSPGGVRPGVWAGTIEQGGSGLYVELDLSLEGDRPSGTLDCPQRGMAGVRLATARQSQAIA